MRYRIILVLVLVLVLLTAGYSALPEYKIDSFEIFLSISTFVFSVFAGFFISRQSSRYTAIRDLISNFDGQISEINRVSMHLGKPVQKKIQEIIKANYKIMFGGGGLWNIIFTKKSTFITDIHKVLDGFKKKKTSNIVVSNALREIWIATHSMQVIRKELIALGKERIPLVQWVFVYFLSAILLIIIGAIPADSSFLPMLLKGAFGTVVLLIVVMLHQFDRLSFFEATIGETTGLDVLDIIEGKK